jgi:hypothetical protein
MKSIKIGKEFKKHAIAILEDRAKSHLLVEILSGLESKSQEVALSALHALSKVLVGAYFRSINAKIILLLKVLDKKVIKLSIFDFYYRSYQAERLISVQICNARKRSFNPCREVRFVYWAGF